MTTLAGAQLSIKNSQNSQAGCHLPSWETGEPAVPDATSSQIPWPESSRQKHFSSEWGREPPSWPRGTAAFDASFPQAMSGDSGGQSPSAPNTVRGKHSPQNSRRAMTSSQVPVNPFRASAVSSQTDGASDVQNTPASNPGNVELAPEPKDTSRSKPPSFNQRRGTYRPSKWPKNSDIKARASLGTAAQKQGLSREFSDLPATSAESLRSDDVDIDSVQADAGDGAATRRNVTHEMEDLTLDIRDFDGNWAPAPPVWEDRTLVKMDGNRTGKMIMSWKDCATSCPRKQVQLDSIGDVSVPTPPVSAPPKEVFLEGQGEICPRDWIIESIDDNGHNAKIDFATWWHQPIEFHPRSGLRDFVRDSDECNDPFWDRYVSHDHDELSPLHILGCALDPNDNDMVKVMQQNSRVSQVQASNKQLLMVRKGKEDRKEKLRSQRAKENYVPERNEYSPTVNIFLRPVDIGDAPQLLSIYNYWRTESIYHGECVPATIDDVRERISDAVEAKLPMIVAVDRSARRSRVQRQRQDFQPEHILGVVEADDYHGMSSMYRYTVEIECWVRPENLRQGIGRTLMDKLISVLDPDYMSVGGYLFKAKEEDELKYHHGGQRVIEWIYVNIPHDSSDKTKLNWNSKWLQRWDFKPKGYQEDIGRKLGFK